MSEENPKYQQILATAKDLFWKFGVKRVSIEEICKEANVSKMTFYKFFSNKRELAKLLMKKVIGKSLIEFEELVHSNLSFEEKVSKMFLIKYEAAKNISVEFINDLHRNTELKLHIQLEEMSRKSLSIFTDFLKDSQQKGLIRKDLKIEFILAFQGMLTHFMDNKELMSKYENPTEFIMESMNFLFYGIITPKGKNA